ncbi:MAG: hypothetical protein V3U54_11320 [Thermodesulfobacteriota bacterium]
MDGYGVFHIEIARFGQRLSKQKKKLIIGLIIHWTLLEFQKFQVDVLWWALKISPKLWKEINGIQT